MPAEHSACNVKSTIEPLLLGVIRSGLCRIEDCEDESQDKHLKNNETENGWPWQTMNRKNHSDVEDKIDSEKKMTVDD